MSCVFHCARWFGMPSQGVFSAVWCLLLFGLLTAIEAAALVKVFRVVAGIARDINGGRT